jgi:hypothetical protein
VSAAGSVTGLRDTKIWDAFPPIITYHETFESVPTIFGYPQKSFRGLPRQSTRSQLCKLFFKLIAINHLQSYWPLRNLGYFTDLGTTEAEAQSSSAGFAASVPGSHSGPGIPDYSPAIAWVRPIDECRMRLSAGASAEHRSQPQAQAWGQPPDRNQRERRLTMSTSTSRSKRPAISPKSQPESSNSSTPANQNVQGATKK